MLEIRLVRHGQSLSNAGEKTFHDHAVPLTVLGKQQSLYYAQGIFIPPTKIIHSPYVRAKETAMPTIQKYNHVSVEEWNVQEFHYLDPIKLGYTTQQERQKCVRHYWHKKDIFYKDSDTCESFADFVVRITDTFNRLAMNHHEHNIVIFSHGYFMKMSLCLVHLHFPAPSPLLMDGFRNFALHYNLHNLDTIGMVYQDGKWSIQYHIHTLLHHHIVNQINLYLNL